MFASGNSTQRRAEDCSGGPGRRSLSTMQIMLIILAVLVVPILLSVVFNRPISQEAATASYPVEPGNSARADAIAFFRQTHQMTMDCDIAGGFRTVATAGAGMGGDPVPLYRAAKKETSICLDVDEHLKGLQLPRSLGRPAAQAFARALTHCENGYLYQDNAAHELTTALNNGGKLEDVASYRSDDATAKAENAACNDGLRAAAFSLGATWEDIAPTGAAVPNQSTSDTPAELQTPPSPYERYETPRIRVLLKNWEGLEDECRGGPHTPEDAVCTARDRAYTKLNEAGWCLGNPDDFEAERVWKPCSMVTRTSQTQE